MNSSGRRKNDTGLANRGDQSIIYGGGWNTPPEVERLKIKAWVALFLTIGAGSGGVYFHPKFGALGFVPSLILLPATGLLFWFERPIGIRRPPDGDYDIRKL